MIEALRRSSAHVFVDSVAHPVLSEDDQRHLSRVLRLRDGESVTCSDGNGAWRECEWRTDAIVPSAEIQNFEAPTQALTVVVAPVKGDKTDLVVEKLVEIGIDHIVLLAPVDHSVVRWSSDKVAQVTMRYQRVARAAAMQSRRIFLPAISGPTELSNFRGPGVAWAEPGGDAEWSHVTTIVIGPEGGFSAAELEYAPATTDLGPAILRAETAAIVGAARMVAHWRR
jgi:16S rRNA (uracil1498-N3)-methyltransferase